MGFDELLYRDPANFNWNRADMVSLSNDDQFWLQKIYIDFPSWKVPDGPIQNGKFEYMKAWLHRDETRFVARDKTLQGVWHSYVAYKHKLIKWNQWGILFVRCNFWGQRLVQADPDWIMFPKYLTDGFDDEFTTVVGYYINRHKAEYNMLCGIATDDGLLMTSDAIEKIWQKNPNVHKVDQIAYVIPQDPANKKIDILYQNMADEWTFLDRAIISYSARIVIGGQPKT